MVWHVRAGIEEDDWHWWSLKLASYCHSAMFPMQAPLEPVAPALTSEGVEK